MEPSPGTEAALRQELCDAVDGAVHGQQPRRRGVGIAMAEQLIRTTSMQISEIAANVGFFDYNYFSKVFHRKFGVSPREYRKKLEDNGTGQEKTAEQGKSNTKKA